MKDIKKGLRELKKSSTLALEVLKVLSEGHDSSAVSWLHLKVNAPISFSVHIFIRQEKSCASWTAGIMES